VNFVIPLQFKVQIGIDVGFPVDAEIAMREASDRRRFTLFDERSTFFPA
jgi:hypothetical protein